MRNVFVDMQKLVSPNSGLGVFCKELGEALVAQKSDISVTLFVPKSKVNEFGGQVRYIVKRIWNKLISPDNKRFQVWHCTHQDSVYFPINPSTKVILTIHDLNFLYKYSGLKLRFKKYKLRRRIERADALVYISVFTKQQVRQIFQFKNKIERIIYNGVSTDRTISKPNFVSKSDSFFFTIGIINPKKNTHVLPQLLPAYPKHKLIIAGKCDTAYRQKIEIEALHHGVLDRVIFCGEINDSEKNWLYQHCTAYFFPSLAEGFGLSVVEAMRFGLPIFLSDRTALPEIGGDVCFYWHSFDKMTMAEVVTNGLEAFQKDKYWKDRLVERANTFSWDVAATQYMELYKQLMP